MTRFARAKGSKSSNEKTPEEATSWLEMKNSLLSKKVNQCEKPEAKEVKVEAPRKAEWASLGDDGVSESTSLLKPNFSKKSKVKNNIIHENGKVKKKKQKTLGEEEGGKGVAKKHKIKNEKNTDSEETNEKNQNKVKKKAKKRKATENEVDSENVQPKKKKKLAGSKEGSELNGKEKGGNADSKKFNNTTAKSKYFKKENEKNFKPGMGRKHFDKPMGKKKFKNKSPATEELVINGEKIQIVKFQGFFVTLEDAERLKTLRNEMVKQGIPKAKLEAAIKLERRRAEKSLSRLKKSVCFHCRGHGHLLSNCPNLIENENTGTGICYKCGSTEHSAGDCKVVKGMDFKFAECFICKEQGHIARQCPDNPRGLYPQGGACRECGDVTHLRKDCPKVQAQKAEEVVTVGLRNDRNLECLDEEIESREKQQLEKVVKKNRTVKF